VYSEILTDDLFGVSALGLGGPTLALLWWLQHRNQHSSVVRWVWAGTWLGLALATITTALLGFTPAVWGSLAGLTALAGFCQICQSPLTPCLLERLARLIQRPLTQALAVLILSVGAAVGWSHWIEYCDQRDADTELLLEDFNAIDRTRVVYAGVNATTDRGFPVRLYVFAQDDYTPETLARSEKRMLEHWHMENAIIRVADADPHYNCHGWTFTGGRYWIRTSEEVEAILAHNGYQRVTKPRINDVIVYRDSAGAIIHTGLVRSAPTDGQILVESKWGVLGRFIHKPEVSCYRGTIEYYRTQRPEKHLLRGLPPANPEPSAPLATSSASPTSPASPIPITVASPKSH
jgi:hypothetical protein